MATRADQRTRLLVVCGPTATGKTDVGIALARRLGGEIVNADSRQVYRYMDIGTAKPAPAQRAAVPHHLLDVVAPDEQFTLADYLERARRVVAQIAARGGLPIVVGGTGLYIRALAQGFAVPRVPPNAPLRAELESLLVSGGAVALHRRLRERDPGAALLVDARNPRRLVRAIEIAESGGGGSPPAAPDGVPRPYDTLVLGLSAERALLYERADRRVDAMMAAGFLEEVRALRARGYSADLPALSSLGYAELGRYLDGATSLAAAVEATRFATHRFIRRQLTWFRREPELCWLDIADGDAAMRATEAARRWLQGHAGVGGRAGA